jgi:hypothetical protein
MIAEERFDPVGEIARLFPVNVDDQGRTVSAAVVDDKREFVELVRVSVRLELLGDVFSEIIERSVRGAVHDSTRGWPQHGITLSTTIAHTALPQAVSSGRLENRPASLAYRACSDQ